MEEACAAACAAAVLAPSPREALRDGGGSSVTAQSNTHFKGKETDNKLWRRMRGI